MEYLWNMLGLRMEVYRTCTEDYVNVENMHGIAYMLACGSAQRVAHLPLSASSSSSSSACRLVILIAQWPIGVGISTACMVTHICWDGIGCRATGHGVLPYHGML